MCYVSASMHEERRVCSKCGQGFDPDVILCPRDGMPLGGRKTDVGDDSYLGLVIACFLLGVVLPILTARMLGACDRTAPTVQQYVDRANAAVAVNAWDQPPGENVKDITDSALKRYPGSEPVLAVRRDAARILVRHALTSHNIDLGDIEALRLARLAHDLDPGNADAVALIREINHTAAVPTEVDPALGKPALPATGKTRVATP